MKFSMVVLVCSFFALLTCSCLAIDYDWIDSSGGGFGESDNWDPEGVPGLGDVALFKLPATYTVIFDTDYLIDKIVVDGSDTTLDLGSHSCTLDYSSESDRAAIIGEYGHGNLLINNGTVYSREVSIGQGGSATGSLTLSGSAAAWTTLYDGNWHAAWIGDYGDAALTILEGAQFRHGHGLSAFTTNSDAVVDVNGIDSEWYVDGQFDMSIWGKTTVDILNSGMVNIGRLTMAYEPGSSAQINLGGISHQTELILHAGLENSLAIGKGGKAGIQVDGSKVWNQGSMTIAENPGSTGLLDIRNSSWVDCWGSAAIGGTLTTPGGAGRVKITHATFSPAVRENESVVVWPAGTITMDDGQLNTTIYADDQVKPIVLKGGTLEGNGMIWAHVENRGGIVAPNDDQDNKVLEMEYNYSQDAAGTLKIAIGGQEPVSQYSHLRAIRDNYGQVSLDGMLDVDLIDGFVPDYWDEFTIIAAQNISGTFNNALSRYVFEDGSFDVTYDTTSDYNSVILTHYNAEPTCSRFLPADFNKDCHVNLADFAIFAAGWLDCTLVPESYCDGEPVIM